MSEKQESICGWLDISDDCPSLFGQAILLRDDDGMGFALDLGPLVGKFVRVTIEVVEPQPVNENVRVENENRHRRPRSR